MKRKLFSVLLTAALLLSATVPALADDDESASSANDTSSDAEFSALASEEGPVEDETTFDAPSAVEGFTADDGADMNDMVSDSDTPDENAVDDADEIVVLDGELAPEEPAEEAVTGESAIDEEPVAEDVPEIVEEPVTEDASETADEPVAEDMPEAADESATEDAPETVEESVTESAPETEDAPETPDESATEDAPETPDKSATEDASETLVEPATESVSAPLKRNALGLRSIEPVAENATEAIEESLTDMPGTALKMMTTPAMAVNAVPLLPDKVSEDEEDDEDDEELFATLFGETPVISVEVPDSGHILINPYCLKVQHGSDIVQDEIISDMSVLVNRSNVALSVQASAIGWAEDSSSEVRFVDDANDMQNKDLFVYYEFQNAPDQSGDVRWSGSYSGASNQLVVRNGANAAPELSEVLTIPAADDDSPTYAAFRAFGSASVPETGNWRATDTVSIRVAFTFTPT